MQLLCKEIIKKQKKKERKRRKKVKKKKRWKKKERRNSRGGWEGFCLKIPCWSYTELRKWVLVSNDWRNRIYKTPLSVIQLIWRLRQALWYFSSGAVSMKIGNNNWGRRKCSSFPGTVKLNWIETGAKVANSLLLLYPVSLSDLAWTDYLHNYITGKLISLSIFLLV